MEHTKDPALKAHIIDYRLEEIRVMLYRQTLFAEFELWLHDATELGLTLTPEIMSEIYFELNKKYHGLCTYIEC